MCLSDVGLTSIREDKSIKVVESEVGPEWNMLEDWTSGRRNDRRIDIKLRAMDSDIGPREVDIVLRILELWSQLTDWAIGRKRE